ncbi:ArnT family glycosyltransferase [Leptospira alstonii]|uniref:Dolichyl-phosphate-mannose-protein mannosyltransferase n=2 Tax=Leptospira alstonii TaxID=28452 RepID=M6DB53_9LEPT|nr:glycosyltransferase family 39 protein [Leptospira alstonii]EMJ95780.1 dolichyl-phosphate-mannose-protein mannosyltransferase [Leptospira alstonii serovar Sichuan str. 79601]EQA79452.1 dolichyl-phosphate-mannose-protein mannosyltransferase [Leptospira alstonii serovar Pingchang str. 80-412]
MNANLTRNLLIRFFLILFFVPVLLFQHFGERKNSALLFLSIVPAFLSYGLILIGTGSFPARFRFLRNKNTFLFLNIPFRFWVAVGITFRIFLLFAEPILSEDVYRFLWDGLLLTEGKSPFSFLPKDFSLSNAAPDTLGLYAELSIKMNSLRFYSVYPPILQILFWFSAKSMLFFGSVNAGVFVWKCFLFCSELGVLGILVSVFKVKKIPLESSLIYWLNPLVFVEIAGNAHPESVLVFFLVGTIWFFFRWLRSETSKDFLGFALFFLGGILTKITPVVLVPFFLFVFWKRKRFLILSASVFGVLIVCGIVILLFPDLILKQSASGLGVFFQLFEFNGSVYYVLREFLRAIGENFYAAGKICATIALVSISAYSFWKRKEETIQNIFSTVETIYLIFFVFSTTVHPWYILPLIVCSIFSGNLYPIVWSFSILVSYSAYSAFPYQDSFGWLCFEYGTLFLFLIMDFKLSSLRKQKETSADIRVVEKFNSRD